MPLHTDAKFARWILDSLNNAIRGESIYFNVPGHILYRLMVRAIHCRANLTTDLVQKCTGNNVDVMPRLVTRVWLFMCQRRFDLGGDVLNQGAAQGNGQLLLAAANPQYRLVGL